MFRTPPAAEGRGIHRHRLRKTGVIASRKEKRALSLRIENLERRASDQLPASGTLNG